MYLYVHYNLYDNIIDHNNIANLSKITIVQNYTSIQWLTNFKDAGQFAIECIATKDNIRYLTIGNTIVRSDNGESGVIEEVLVKGNRMSIKGHLDCLDKIVNTKAFTVENVVNGLKELLKNNQRGTLKYNLVNNGVLPSLKIEPLSIQNDNLRKIIIDICKRVNIGYKISKYDISIYSGRDLSKSKVFSDEIGNVINEQLIYDITNFYGCAVVMGDGEEGKRQIAYVNNPNIPNSIKLPYSEIFVDGKSIKKTYKDSNNIDCTYSDSQYLKLLEEQGLAKLYECNSIQSYKCDINLSNSTYVFGKDYLLGDIISIWSKKYNLNIKVRIIAVKEIWENGTKKINLTLENI